MLKLATWSLRFQHQDRWTACQAAALLSLGKAGDHYRVADVPRSSSITNCPTRARTRTCQARQPGQFVRFTFSKRGQSVPPVLCQAQVALQQHAWGHDSSGGCGDLSTSLPIRALLKTQTHSRILPTVSFRSPSVMGVVAHTWGLLRSTGHGAEVHRRGCRPAARPREGCVVAEPRVRFH